MKYQDLTKSGLFHGLNDEEIQALLHDVHPVEKHYARHEVVFYLEDLADRIGIILRGEILVSKIFESGKLVRMTVKNKGDMIGEAACFSYGKTYPCQLSAEKDADVLIFTRDDMKKILQADDRVLQNFLSELAGQTYFLQRKVELLSYKGTDQKLAFFLLTQSKSRNSKMIPIPGSIVKMSLIMNVSRTTLHREIRNLEENGLIRYQNKIIEIRDSQGLRELLSEE